MNTELIINILIYYALVWIIVTPIAIVALLIMNKKSEGKIFKKYNALLDRLVGLPTEGEKKEQEGKDNNNTDRQDVNPENLPENKYIGRFLMATGEKYRCNLSTFEIDNLQGVAHWSVKNNFVGKIGELDGEFTALREGVAEIMCNGEIEYIITVIASDGKWDIGSTINRIAKRDSIDNVFLSSQSGRRPKKIDFKRNTATYGTLAIGHRNTIYGYSQGRELERVLYIFEPQEKKEDEIVKRLDTRAIEVGEEYAKQVPGHRFWVHIGEDKSVDVCIIMKKTKKNLYLGVCRNWRKGGVLAEVEANPSMILQMFADIAPDDFRTKYTPEGERDSDKKENGQAYPMRADATEKKPGKDKGKASAEPSIKPKDAEKKNQETSAKAEEQLTAENNSTELDPNDIPDIGDEGMYEEGPDMSETDYNDPSLYQNMEGSMDEVNEAEAEGAEF